MFKNIFLVVSFVALLVSSNIGLSEKPFDELAYFAQNFEEEEPVEDDFLSDETLRAPDDDNVLHGKNFVEKKGIDIAHVNPKHRECLAKAIFWEARNQSFDGKVAVGLVVMNRVRSTEFGENACKVVYQGCQFSWVCTKNKKKNPANSKNADEREAWAESISLANELLLEYDSFVDVTKGATHFHAKYVKPDWSRWKKMERTVRIDDHIFYRMRSM